MANFDLKSIFASEDKYTIIQLLKEFVNKVDGTEFTKLYEHRVTMKDNHGDDVTIRIINKNATELSGSIVTLNQAIKGAYQVLIDTVAYIPVLQAIYPLGSTSITLIYVGDDDFSSLIVQGNIISDVVFEI